MATTASPGHRRAGAPRWLDLVGLALLAYVPALLSSPGRVSADSKQYLYLDPGAFLRRAPYLWDAQAGAGGVSHQHIGYLWPMGPWFWALDAVGFPPWVAQRLWLGTLALVAALGTRWLLTRLGLSRAGVLAGTLVYLLTPFQLAFTARSSVLLLPWAALPWLVGLTDRAHREGGWRDPAWIALIVLSVGSVNASSLVLVAVGPAVWLLAGVTGRPSGRRAVGVVARTGVLALGASLWWIAALRLEGAYGLPVLQVTENLQTVAATSSPSDVLRGLGNWFFYGRDRLGYSIDQAQAYLDDRFTVAVTFGLAALGIAAAILVRWRHRGRFVALVLVGTVVSVGAWPLDDPSPFAHAVASFTETSVGLALRNTARAAPVVVLGLAGLLGAAVSAMAPIGRRWAASAAVGALALAGMNPVLEQGLLSDHQDRVDPIPAYWSEAARDLDAGGRGTRVLELPGSNFSAYRWGNAVDPILPGLMERPYVSREVLPLGSASSALLIDALDRRLQEGTLEPAAIAPIARLLGVGDVVVRSDLEYERFRTPNPRALWDLLTGTDVAGLGEPTSYGEPVPNRASAELPMIDEIELRARTVDGEPPPVAVFSVDEPVPIVRTAPSVSPIVVAGDADGIVDAAAAGLIDGQALVLQATSLPEDELDATLGAGADVIVTDTYRRRIQTWFYAIRDTRGPTERAGETLPEPTGYDVRIDPTPEVGDERRTVVAQEGGTVTATGGGGAPRPEDRAMAAVDGDPRTAWRVGGADPTGTRWRLQLPGPVAAGQIVLAQPSDGPRDRWITDVRLHVDDRAAIDVTLTEASFGDAGQVIDLGAGDVQDLEVEITGVSTPPFDPQLANAVGFREITVPGVAVVEWVEVPTDLLTRAGPGHRADIVLSRLRYEPGDRGRLDQELALRRVFDLPTARSFTISGTARVDPNAIEADALDGLLATALVGGKVHATSHLTGDLGSRASRAIDGDPGTMWQSAFGPPGDESFDVIPAEPGAVKDLLVHVVQDSHHSVPRSLTLVADGEEVGTVDVPAPTGGAPMPVALPAPPAGARQLSIRVGDVLERNPVPGAGNPADILPVAFSEVEGTGVPRAVDGEAVAERCQPLVRVDGVDVPVRVVGTPADARRGLEVEACAAVDLEAGEHRVETSADGGVTIDRLVLSSGPDGAAAPLEVRGVPRGGGAAEVEVDDQHRGVEFDLRLDSEGDPFWLVLGQSDNRGWDLDVDGATVGPRQVVDGYANGWLITPDGAGSMSATLTWGPQRLIWLTLLVSALSVLACIALIVRGRRAGDPPSGDARLAHPPAGRAPLTPGAPGLAVAVGVVVLLAATPEAAAVASAAVVIGLAVPRATWVWAGLAAALVLGAQYFDRPTLAWVALALVAADLVVEGWLGLSRRQGRVVPDRPPARAP